MSNGTSIINGQNRMWHELNIAGLHVPNNVFLAPMAGYTNYPFRKLCLKLGAGLSFTEMVSCKGLQYGNEETKKLLYCGEQKIKAAQIFGCDPQIMRRAIESEPLDCFDLIDINMGCPMPKIVNNGEGSALLENFSLAEKVIAECVKSGKRISVKFRIGVKEGDRMAGEFAKLCEGAGACMVTVHGRVREKIYAGEPDFRQIEEAKKAVKIPVIANGGIFSVSDAKRMIDETGADGIMIARAALYQPNLFAQILQLPQIGVREWFPSQLQETRELLGERFATVFMRKMAAFYVKGKTNSVEWKRKFFSAQSTEEVLALVNECFENGMIV